MLTSDVDVMALISPQSVPSPIVRVTVTVYCTLGDKLDLKHFVRFGKYYVDNRENCAILIKKCFGSFSKQRQYYS